MPKSRTETHHLALVLIVGPIFVFALYLDTKDFVSSLSATVLGGLLAYKILLPLTGKLAGFLGR